MGFFTFLLYTHDKIMCFTLTAAVIHWTDIFGESNRFECAVYFETLLSILWSMLGIYVIRYNTVLK